MSDKSYRIEYQIQRAVDGGEFEEIGFGSSGEWSDVDQAVHMLGSEVQNRGRETEPGQPDPNGVDDAD